MGVRTRKWKGSNGCPVLWILEGRPDLNPMGRQPVGIPLPTNHSLGSSRRFLWHIFSPKSNQSWHPMYILLRVLRTQSFEYFKVVSYVYPCPSLDSKNLGSLQQSKPAVIFKIKEILHFCIYLKKVIRRFHLRANQRAKNGNSWEEWRAEGKDLLAKNQYSLK